MSERRLPLGVMLIAPVVAGFGLYAFTTQEPVPDPSATPSVTATSTATPTETAATPSTGTPAPPTPVATAVPPGAIHPGAWVRVNAGAGDCLNARNQPSLTDDYVIVNFCLPDGFEGYVAGDATEQDGHRWWFLAGAGWVAEDYLLYLREADLRAPMAPALAGLGRIAFVRDGDVWVMEADGSAQRRVWDNPEPGEYPPMPVALRWSPDGALLSFNITRFLAERTTSDLYVLSLTADGGASARVFPAMLGDNWSPDSRYVGIIGDPNIDGMGGGAEGPPGILDLETGAARYLGSERFAQQRPPAFNFDGTLLLLTYNRWQEPVQPAILVWDREGREVHRIAPPEGAWYADPRWSPVDNRIAFHASTPDGAPRYAVYDLAQGAIVAGVDVPRASDKIGGRCGGADMWRMEWSRDGSTLYFSFSMGDTNANGIWAWDIAHGAQALIYAASAGPAAAGPDAWFTFGAWSPGTSYIFAGTAAGGFPLLITDGDTPSWWSPR